MKNFQPKAIEKSLLIDRVIEAPALNIPKYDVTRQGFYRLTDIVGNKKNGTERLIPISKSTLWQWIKDGKFPAPTKLGVRISAWPKQQIHDFIDEQNKVGV